MRIDFLKRRSFLGVLAIVSAVGTATATARLKHEHPPSAQPAGKLVTKVEHVPEADAAVAATVVRATASAPGDGRVADLPDAGDAAEGQVFPGADDGVMATAVDLPEGAVIPPFVPSPSPSDIRGATLALTDVQVIGGDKVHVAAKSFVYDKQPGMRYLWVLSVTSPADKATVLFRKIYVDNISAPPGVQGLNLLFDDIVAPGLQAGDYTVEIALFYLDPALGLATLDDPRTRGLCKALSLESKITIGN